MANIRILALGDVVGSAATEALSRHLPAIRRETGADFVIVNAENIAAGQGNGTDVAGAQALLAAGADVLTGGNHTFSRHRYYDFLDKEKRALRPANLPGECPGDGSVILTVKGYRILCINLIGRVYMTPDGSCPFAAADRILKNEAGNYDLAAVDFHGEATAEKIALARYLDGRVTVFFGTHTHVQTADERIYAGGTGYISDLGMCGPEESVLGIDPDAIITHFKRQMPTRFLPAQGDIRFHGALFDTDTGTGKALRVERFCRRADEMKE